MIWERLSLCCCCCLFCFLSLSVCWWVYVLFFFKFFLGGRGLGWVVLFKIPWSIYLMLFRVTNLSALLLPYFTVMLFFFFFFFLLLHGSGNQLVFLFFFFPISVLVFLGMMSIPLLPHSSWLFPICQHCFSFNINISWFLLLWQVNIYYAIFTKHCCMYMILSWLRLGSGGPCLHVFFFHPTRPKHREIKMKKKKKKKKKKVPNSVLPDAL